MDTATKNICQKIGQFYLNKCNGDHKAAQSELCHLIITDVSIPTDGNLVIIKAVRVGMLIGKRGSNIDALEKFLKVPIKVIEEQESVYNWILPFVDF